jgi:hypothetical protein
LNRFNTGILQYKPRIRKANFAVFSAEHAPCRFAATCTNGQFAIFSGPVFLSLSSPNFRRNIFAAGVV